MIQAPSGPKEDPGYPYGGWAPFSGPAAGAAIVAAHREAFDLLLGCRTYDIWSGFWPKAPKSPMADSINAATKYVATHRPDSLGWGPVEGLGADIAEGICRIKAKDGPDLIVWGSSTLTPVLLEHGLADEILLFVFPVLLGTGKRLFSEGTPPRELALVGTKAVSSGVIISTYRPSGPFADRQLWRRGGVRRRNRSWGGYPGQTARSPVFGGVPNSETTKDTKVHEGVKSEVPQCSSCPWW